MRVEREHNTYDTRDCEGGVSGIVVRSLVGASLPRATSIGMETTDGTRNATGARAARMKPDEWYILFRVFELSAAVA